MTITVVRYNIVTSTEGNERSIISTPSAVKEPSKYCLAYLTFHGNEAYIILCYKLQKYDRDVETYLVSDLDISATDEKVDIV